MAKLKANYKRDLDAQIQSFKAFKDAMGAKKKFMKVINVDKTKLVQLGIVARTIGISAFVSIIVFMMIQVIWADSIKSALPEIVTVSQSLFWVELVLLIGLLSGLGISSVIFIIYGMQKDKSGERKIQMKQMLKSALWAALVTFIILTITSYIGMLVYDPFIFYGLNIIDLFGSFLEVIADFVIFIYPNPTGYWIITIAIYYSILTVFFVLLVSRSKRMDGLARKKAAEKLRDRISGRKPSTTQSRAGTSRGSMDISSFLH